MLDEKFSGTVLDLLLEEEELALGEGDAVDIVLFAGIGVGKEDLGGGLLDDGSADGTDEDIVGALRGEGHDEKDGDGRAPGEDVRLEGGGTGHEGGRRLRKNDVGCHGAQQLKDNRGCIARCQTWVFMWRPWLIEWRHLQRRGREEGEAIWGSLGHYCAFRWRNTPEIPPETLNDLGTGTAETTDDGWLRTGLK